MQRKKILSVCFGLSLFLHGMAVLCFQKYSLWFSSTQRVPSGENWLSLVDKKDRDQILKSTFDPMSEEGENRPSLRPVHEEELVLTIKPNTNSLELMPEDSISFQLPFPSEEVLLTTNSLPTFSLPSQSFNLLDHLPKDLYIPTISKPTQPIFNPMPTETALSLAAKPLSIETDPTNSVRYESKMDLSLSEEPQVGKMGPPLSLSSLPHLPTLDELETSSYSDSFEADLVFSPKEDGKGYIFALTLIPRSDLNLPRLTQHITFLIDRSNSIQQSRLAATKSAVNKALEMLNPEDTFNIIAFDNKMDKMSPHYLSCTKKSQAMAEEFLSKIQLGSFFSTSDLYKPLFLTVPSQIGQDEIHTAVLLTDGESLGKKGNQKTLFSDWTGYNAGKVALYAVGMNDNYLPKLDAVAAVNRGKLIHATNPRGMKRKLLKLLKTIKSPVAKNISCRAISRTPGGKITLLPKSSQMPHLYQDQPYVILGETETLDDFILFVQAKLKDRWLNIKKTISFLNAKKGNRSLKQEWAQQIAYQLYQEFTLDEDPKHIADAKALLEPYDMQVAF